MKLVARLFAAILFVLFFGFAIMNSHEVTLRFFFSNDVHTPLALLLLAFLVAGAVLGVLAMTPTVFRNHRELSKHRKMLAEESAQQALRAAAPPDGITTKPS